jgi:hypothetical protein
LKTYQIDLPLFIPISPKKNLSLNLNIYRNAHFFELNKAKELFHQYIGQILVGIPHINKLKIQYTLFVPTKRRLDISNICSIVDKFFCDTLTANKIIDDDSYDILIEVNYKFGGIDKENPRVEALLMDLDSIEDKKEPIMRITLVQTEIEEALTEYLLKQINISDGQKIEIDLKATRGEEGYLAEISVHSAKNGLDVAPKENTSSSVTTAPVDIFKNPDATMLDVRDSATQAAAEATSTQAPTVQAEATPPLTQQPVQSASPAAVEAEVKTETTPTAVPARSLFGDLSAPVNSPKVA